MAEIVDQLRLDITEALRDIDRIESSLDRALAPIKVEVDIDERSAQELEATLRDVEQIANRAATETQGIALAAGRAEVNFEDVARALNISENAARELSTEILQAQAAANRLEDSARDVARQLGLSEDEARRFVGQLQRADRAADDIRVSTGTLVGNFGALRGAAAGVAGILATIGLGTGIALAARGARAALTEFQALNESINAVNVTFESASDQVLAFGQKSAQAAGLSASAFQQSVVPIGAVLTNFGFSANEAADASITLVQRAADLASVFNTDVNEALLAINSALVGQVEPLRRYGAEISQTRVEAYALANGLVNANGEIDEQARTAARVQLILQDTSKVQGDFVNTSDELANAQRIATAEVEEFGASVGEVLAPAMAAAIALLPPLLEGFRQLVPAIAGGAESAAAFFEASGKGGGFRAEGAGVAAFFDAVFSGGGVAANFAGILAGMGKDLLEMDSGLNNTGHALERFNNILEEPIVRGIAVKFAQALDAGKDAVQTFGQAMSATATTTRSLETFKESYRGLANAANLSQPQLLGATRQLLANRVALQLSAPEVRFLTGQYNALNEELDTGGRANADYIASVTGVQRANADLAGSTAPLISALDEVRLTASEAGLSMGDLVAGTDPVAAALFRTLDPAEQLRFKLEEVRSGAITMADAFRERVVPSIFDASEALIDFDENAKVSTDEWVRGLNEGVAAALEFRNNLRILFDLDPKIIPILADLQIEDAMEQARLLVQDPTQIPIVIAASQDVQGVAAIMQADILRVLELVREGAPELEIADFINLSSDPERGFGPEFLDQLVAAQIFAMGGAQDQFIGPDFKRLYVEALEDVDVNEIEAITDKIFADLDPPEYPKPKFQPLDPVEAQRAADQIFNDLNPPTYPTPTLPDFTPVVTAAIEGTNTAEVTAAMDTALGASFTDLEPPEFTPIFVEAVKAVDKSTLGREVGGIFDALEFAINFFDEGREGRKTYMAGLSTPISGETGRLRQSIVRTLNAAENKQSPPKLFLDAGIEAGETFWMGFNEADLELELPDDTFKDLFGKVTGLEDTISGVIHPALLASFADLPTADISPAIARGFEAIDAAQITSALDTVLGSPFADVELPDLTANAVSAVRGMDSAAIAAAVEATIGGGFGAASFADLELPEIPALTVSFADVELPEIPAFPELPALTVSFADVELPDISFADLELPELPTLTFTFSFADLELPDIPEPTADQKADLGDSIAAMFEQDDALNRAAGFTADVYAEQLIQQMGIKAFATGEALRTFIETQFTQEASATTAANLTADAYEGDLIAGLKGMDSAAIAAAVEAALSADVDIDLAAEGREARATFIDGLTARSGGETGRLRQSILSTVNGAIQRQSPPQLFLDAGMDSGEAFWLGFEQADMNLRLPTPSFTGTVTTSEPTAGDSGGFTFSPTYVNTETKDLETVVARSEQLMSSVAGILNGRFKL